MAVAAASSFKKVGHVDVQVLIRSHESGLLDDHVILLKLELFKLHFNVANRGAILTIFRINLVFWSLNTPLFL